MVKTSIGLHPPPSNQDKDIISLLVWPIQWEIQLDQFTLTIKGEMILPFWTMISLMILVLKISLCSLKIQKPPELMDSSTCTDSLLSIQVPLPSISSTDFPQNL